MECKSIMKVCVITLVKTPNSGSYLQGKALGVALEQLGHTVCYYDFDYLSRNAIADLKGIIGMLVVHGVAETKNYLTSQMVFAQLQKKLAFVKNVDDVDCFILGSDTIWNIGSDNLAAHSDVLWGSRFAGKKVITYAGSVANAQRELFLNNDQLSNAVCMWSAISVRDEYTKTIISQLAAKDIQIVCDPTLLLQKSDYESMAGGVSGKMPESEYIYLYLFKELSHEQSKELKAFAEKHHLKIVLGVNGKRHGVADYSVINSPLHFLKYMLGAKYVITDTFHGTVFSINLNKQFVSINRGKNKVIEALRTLEFSDRLVDDKQPLVDRLTSVIRYKERTSTLDKLRRDSWDFLKTSLY